MVHSAPSLCSIRENDTNLVSTHLRFFSHPQISLEAPGTVKPQLIVGEKAEEHVVQQETRIKLVSFGVRGFIAIASRPSTTDVGGFSNADTAVADHENTLDV
jgi:hypothetical protein